MTCTCNPVRTAGHRPECPIAWAMRSRCPECRSRRPVGSPIRHTNLCKLKEYQP